MKGDSMSSAPATGGRPRLNLAYGSWDLIWSHTHRTLLVNLGVAVTNLPLLVALSLCHQPWRHPAPFTLLLFAVGPSLAGAFGYLRRADEDERAPAIDFCHAYARLFRRALLLWSPFALLAVAAAADAAAVFSSALGPVLVPPSAVIVLVAVSAGVVAMAHLAAGDQPVTPRAFLAAPYVVVRRWPLGLLNLGLLAVTAGIVNQAPLLGLAVVPGCALFVIWRNSCSMLTATHPKPEADPA